MSDTSLQDYVNQKISSGQSRAQRNSPPKRIAQAGSGNALPLDIDSIKRQLADELNADGTKK